jgi:DNA-binding protein HU-beta
MTKAEIVRYLVEKSGLPRKDAVLAVELFLNSIKEALQSGEKVSLVGFGTFLVTARNPRSGHNPRTREKIQIEKKCVARFKPGKAFREAVNQSGSSPNDSQGSVH